MSRRTNKVRTGARHGATRSVERQLAVPGLLVLVMLVACMFLWPSEAAVHGDGLHLSFLWLAAAAAMFFWNFYQCYKQPEASFGRGVDSSLWSRFSARSMDDVGLFLLIAGIWLSTWHVFRVDGDRRAALNLAFEWTGIGACAYLCRTIFVTPTNRQTVVTLIAGLGVGLAVFGMWKSHVVYSAEAQSYREKRQVLDTDAGSMEAVRIRQEFLTSDIPMEGTARQLFENRLLNSSEPFATFALANTFAGVLSVALVLLIARVVSGWQSPDHSAQNFILPSLLVAVVGWCLILTKSRTAWIGTGIGIVVITLSGSGTTGIRSALPRSLQRILLIAALGAVILVVCILTGVIDRQVMLEAPRSFRFRLFYWIGAASVIMDNWLFGAGPGNFRQLYLRYKVVESSESIVDPHNIVLDTWCFAGIIGLTGLLFFVSAIAKSWGHNDTKVTTASCFSSSVVGGLAGCLGIHFGWHWISGGTLAAEDGMLTLAIAISAGSMMIISRLPWNPSAPAAALIALLVHLLGAGGLHISIVGILLVVLGYAASTPNSAVSLPGQGTRAYFMFTGGLLTAVMAVTVLYFGVVPVRSSGIYQSLGQQRMYSNDLSGATAAFEQAVAADPLAPTARQHIVTATAYELLEPNSATRRDAAEISGNLIESIDTACREWIASDQRQLNSRLIRAKIRHELFRRTKDEHYAISCLSDLRQAVSWYPTNARLQIELAACEDEFGSHDKGVAAAEQALKIESVNRQWLHTDQYLTKTDLLLAQRIIDGTEE